MATTKDEYIKSVYKVIFYIEQNYDKNLTLDKLSKVAGFSKYHFHRIFKSIMSESVADYIRKVRLQSAILKFKSDVKVTQVALESGYETNASFSKAFKKRFGVTPKNFAKKMKLKKGYKMLKPKIVNINPINVLYVRRTGNYALSASEAWNMIVDFAYKKNLSGKIDMRYGIAYDNPNIVETDNLRYDACIELNDKSIKPNGEIHQKQISGGKYAVVLHNGSYELLGETYKNISDWIIEGGITLRDEPLFQKYLDLDPRKVEPQKLQTEIYVPIE